MGKGTAKNGPMTGNLTGTDLPKKQLDPRFSKDFSIQGVFLKLLDFFLLFTNAGQKTMLFKRSFNCFESISEHQTFFK